MLVGLLAVDPHRLYLYWELPGSHGWTMTLYCGACSVSCAEGLPPAGGLYLEELEADRAYRAEFARRSRVLARSNEAVLPPDGAPRPGAEPAADPLSLALPALALPVPAVWAAPQAAAAPWSWESPA